MVWDKKLTICFDSHDDLPGPPLDPRTVRYRYQLFSILPKDQDMSQERDFPYNPMIWDGIRALNTLLGKVLDP